ncbi:MAG: ABC transporter permease subunit [Rhodospirillales bacterium]
MRRAGFYRALIVAGMLATIEVLCRIGIVTPFTMPAPTRIVYDLAAILRAGSMMAAIAKTLRDVAMAVGLSVFVGVAVGVAIHRLRGLRQALEPLFATYYAIPVYAFYPLFIVLFGLGSTPQVLIGFMLATIAMLTSTLSGLDRVPPVLLRTACAYRLGAFETARQITLPCAAPLLVTGVKLAVSYAFIGVVGAEFIMSRDGLGYEINYSYNNFDNATMYPAILTILLLSTGSNMALQAWERILLTRRGR